MNNPVQDIGYSEDELSKLFLFPSPDYDDRHAARRRSLFLCTCGGPGGLRGPGGPPIEGAICGLPPAGDDGAGGRGGPCDCGGGGIGVAVIGVPLMGAPGAPGGWPPAGGAPGAGGGCGPPGAPRGFCEGGTF